MLTPILAAWICIFSPFAGAAVTPVLARMHPMARDLGAVLFSFSSAVAALYLLPELFHPDSLPLESKLSWLDAPIGIGFGVLLDPLSIVLANVVAVVSFIIMGVLRWLYESRRWPHPVLDVDEWIHRQHAAAGPLQQSPVRLRGLEIGRGL